jgi:hypothetical protein
MSSQDLFRYTYKDAARKVALVGLWCSIAGLIAAMAGLSTATTFCIGGSVMCCFAGIVLYVEARCFEP